MLLLLVFASCRMPGSDNKRFDRTPAGWHVHWIEQGTQLTGRHTKLELLVLFDAAMERALAECATKVGLPEAYCRGKIRSNDALYTLVDNFYFPVPLGSAADAPLATFATGETFNSVEVTVAFYDKDRDTSTNPTGAVNPTQVPADAPAWAIKPSASFPGLVYYGYEYDGSQYPALGYELHWQFTDVP